MFDKKGVEKGQVKFYDVAYLEAKPIVKRKNKKRYRLSPLILAFSGRYRETEENCARGSRVVIEKRTSHQTLKG